MDRTDFRSSYGVALLWVALFAALAVSINIVTELVLVDFVHGNSHRSHGNALGMMIIFPVMFSIISMIGIGLVFGPAQVLQAATTNFLTPKYGRSAFLFMILMLPIAGIVTWYSYDYLTPSDFNLGINEGADWTPYQHGISWDRLFNATMAQAIVAAFTAIYCNTEYLRLPRRYLLIGVSIVSVLGGIAWGYHLAMIQYEFID